MKKVIFIATVVKTHIMEFHIPYLKMFKDMGWYTAVAAKNDYDLKQDCDIPYCDKYYDLPFERKPLSKNNIIAYNELKKILESEEYDIIHCHTPVGAMITRLAAIKVRKRGSKVFYTAHGFHFYNNAPIINWLLYYPVERLLANVTDTLITINKEDYKRALNFNAKEVYYVPGVGIDLNKFKKKTEDASERIELPVGKEDFVILSVGELIERKNHQLVLEALYKIKKENSISNIKYIICGSGRLENELKQKTEEMGLEDIVFFLGYRKDIDKICNYSDLFVFMSLQEGLPVALMEAMACGVACVVSDIRGNNDLIINKQNGLIVDFDAEELSKAIVYMKDNEYDRNRFANNAIKSVDIYNIDNVLSMMKKIYGV